MPKADPPAAPAANSPHRLDKEAIDLITRTQCQGWTKDQIDLFIYQCNRTGLDPLTRQIYGQLRFDKNLKDAKGKKVGGQKLSIVTSIDGFRLIAERTGEYEGQTEPLWCGEDGVWKDVWIGKKYPAAAKIGVWRKNFREPTMAVANFDAYAPTYDDGNLSGLWPKMFVLMISKCSEALALRKAFPNELSGLYTSDEMAQAGKETAEDAPEETDAEKGKRSAAVAKTFPGARSAHEDEEIPPDEDENPRTKLSPARPPEEGRSGPRPPAPTGKGLAGSNIAGLHRKPSNVVDMPQSDNDGAGFDLPPAEGGMDAWQIEDLKKVPAISGKLLGTASKAQLEQIANLGDQYVAHARNKAGDDQAEQDKAAAMALRAVEAAKLLLKAMQAPAEEPDEIPGL